MGRLASTENLTEEQTAILETIRDFVDEKIIPVAQQLEHDDEYPTEIIEGLKELGVFGLTIPEEFGGLGESLLTYALVVEEIARGWMSVSGVINTHFIVAYLLQQHGTEEQKQKYLPQMAVGEVRGAFSMSEPGPRLRRLGRLDEGDEEGRRLLLDHRPEDVADQRRHVDARGGALQDRRGC
ncbi:MAG: acyl-CoA dehydrogenase family protein [Aeromicrobium erythreum]